MCYSLWDDVILAILEAHHSNTGGTYFQDPDFWLK